MTRRNAIDVGVLTVLSFIAVLGFEPAFGQQNFLLAGVGGLIVGTGVAVLASSLRFGVLLSVLTGIAAYFLLGSAFTMPAEATLVVLPNLTTLAGLALGAVYGWADILTLSTPVEAPYYLPVLPFFAAWLVSLVSTMLAIRWLTPERRTVRRSAVLLVGPAMLYVAGILVGTDEAYLAGLRGVSFAVIALIWLGWRRAGLESATADGARILRRKITGTAIIVVGAVVVGALLGAVLTPPPGDRFVLREKIEPPFDPLDYPSPLAGFRSYTKDLADTELLTVSGLKSGQTIRLAAMDAYSGRLWDVAGPDVDRDGGFRLVGSSLPAPSLFSRTGSETLKVTIDDYSDVWLPSTGYPSSLDFGSAPPAVTETLRYNADTGTAVLGGGIEPGFRYSMRTAQQKSYRDEDLATVPIAKVALPPAENIPDVVVAKAIEFAGDAETPIAQLRAIESSLKTQGFLSHGLASDAVPSRAGHGADRMVELFTRSQMVGDQEQYASAMALMARSLGYPARVVLGFAPEVSDEDQDVTITGDDVTAWVEVAFDEVGWIPFYPTPEQTDVPQDQTPKPKSEPQPQVRQPPRSENRADDLLTAVEVDDSDRDKRDPLFAVPLWAWVVGGIIGIPLLVIGIPLLVIAVLKRRRRARRRNRGSGDHRVAGAWDELADGYAELGFDVPRRASRTQAARRLEEQLQAEGVTADATTAPDGQPAPGPIRLLPIADAVDAAVFGGTTIEDATVGERWSEVDASLSVARTAVGRTRRLLSAFRIRSKRDWNRVDLSGSASAARPNPAE
ncbi:MAG: transglutaminase domain-containing protein [Leifsonia sp.]